jgi:PmbA protein
LGAFSNIFNAQSVLDKQSLSTPDSIGETIASPYLSLADDALHPDNVGMEAFDEEGTPTRRLELISQGKLTSFLHSTVTAKRMNTNPTGHGRIGAKVGVGRHFYHVYSEIKPEQTFSLDDAENVILIDSLNALHAGVNSLQGSFSLPFDGWLVNRGEKVSIDAATVAGDIKDVLKAIMYVEPEGEVVPSGVCPHVWVKDLAVTGE